MMNGKITCAWLQKHPEMKNTEWMCPSGPMTSTYGYTYNPGFTWSVKWGENSSSRWSNLYLDIWYTGGDFEYDALLSYDEEMDTFVLNELVKELQERRKIRIYIEFRDMLMGAYTNEELANITNKRWELRKQVAYLDSFCNEVFFILQIVIN